MASLSHSALTDYPNKRICQEASSPLYNNPTVNNMQDLYAFMHTLHPHLQARPPYVNIGKPFYYSSNVQGLNKLINGEDEPSLITSTSTSWDDQLHPHNSVEAMESKGVFGSGISGENLNVNAAKKRIRAVMDCKDVQRNVESKGEMKRMKSSNAGDVNVQKSELITEVKPTNDSLQILRGNSSDKQHNTEQKSSETKSNVKASSPTIEQDSPTKLDFIHVRARRGQATDSHSLAERVRREKISERMKYLQDLVPGCVKVTGKAMMLDEIINYVQSLQRQVEFLSMKIAAVHSSKLEFNLDFLFGKKVVQSNNVKDGSTQVNVAAVQAFTPPLDYQGNVDLSYSHGTFCDSMRLPEVNPSMLQTANQRPCSPADFLATLNSDLGVDDTLMPRTAASCLTTSAADCLLEPAHHSCISQDSQLEPDWDDDLQNFVQQMGFLSQTSSLFLPHQLTEGLFLQGQMKAEL